MKTRKYHHPFTLFISGMDRFICQEVPCLDHRRDFSSDLKDFEKCVKMRKKCYAAIKCGAVPKAEEWGIFQESGQSKQALIVGGRFFDLIHPSQRLGSKLALTGHRAHTNSEPHLNFKRLKTPFWKVRILQGHFSNAKQPLCSKMAPLAAAN